MTKYRLHPLCEKFPQMPADEFNELVEDIRINGQRDPIWVYGKVLLDGKHRLEACEVLGRTPDVREWKPKHGPEEPQIKAFVLSRNFYRRHLSAGQRALLAAELVTTNGDFKRPERVTTANAVVTQGEAASAAGVSVDAVQRASAVLGHGSKPLQEAVRNGDVTVSDAAKIVDLPKAEQTAAVRAVENGRARTVSAAVGKRSKAKHETNGATREPGDDPTEPEHDDSVRDQLKRPVPASLRPVFAEVAEFNRLRRLCADIKAGAKNLLETPAGGWLSMQEIGEHADQIKRLVRFAAPYTECAKCRRKIDRKCAACKGTGWVTEAMFQSAFSDADKKWLEQR